MEIKELYIKNFGKFSERHFVLEEGVHIFYGENEYGKSTIYAFIKAMLFGLERSRGRAAQNDEFSCYEPWDNPNNYAGSMRFISGGKTFLLERRFDRYTKGASLICEDDGEQLSLADGDLEMLLGGITRDVFESTSAIGQLTAKPGQELAEALKNYAANYYETGSSTVDLNGAVESLRIRRKNIEQDIRKQAENREKQVKDICRKMDYVSDDILKLQKEFEENQKKQKDLQFDLTRKMKALHESDLPQVESSAESKAVSGISLIRSGIGGMLAGIAGVVFSIIAKGRFLAGNIAGIISTLSWAFLVVGGLLVVLGGVKYMARKRGNGSNSQTQNSQEEQIYLQQIKQDETNLQKVEWGNQRIQAELKEKQIKQQNLQEQLEELETSDAQSQALQKTKQALILAEETLQRASKNMTHGFGNVLNQNASTILSQITKGKYTRLLIDEQLNMVLYEDGRRIPVERVSQGTIEQVYFALRMAAIDVLFEETIPIIVDEAFAYYDEKRLKSALKWLSEQQRQVIIFTCQKREQEIVKQF